MNLHVPLACLSLFVSVAAAQNRPQTPEAPFPYRVQETTVPSSGLSESGEPTHTLGATVTLPDAAVWGEGPYPGVVLVTGSGPQDRDETILGHKPFLVLADHLTRRGIAVLRYDDRGVGESTGSFGGTTVLQLAADAQDAWRHLRDHPATDPGRTGIAGHSEGGLIAPIVACDEPGVAFLVLLAGTGSPGSELLLEQARTMFESGSSDGDWIDQAITNRRAVFEMVHAGASDDEVLAGVVTMMRHELPHLKDPAAAERVARQSLPAFAGPWAREFITLDPGDYLPRVGVPVLALNGTLDTQVSIGLNLEPIEAALNEGVCPAATTVRLKGLNHLFQPATTGLMGEYATIETTFDEHAMGVVSGWISSVTGMEPPMAGE